jgi:hypothetical protein
MNYDDLFRHYPVLFHMAEEGSWPGIERHGLLSTTALLDLYEINGSHRAAIETQHRPESVEVRHRLHGTATIRDQKPMDDTGLKRALRDGLTPPEWYMLLNSRVFFWLSRERLDRLLNARAYRNRKQTVLTVDTEELVQRHASNIRLSPINSGATKPMPHPRGRDTFLAVPEYPFDEWAKRRRSTRNAVVELTVDHAVPDIRDFVHRVELVEQGKPTILLWQRAIPAS